MNQSIVVRLARTLACAVTALLATPAGALVAQLDSFTLTRIGSVIFRDDFNGGFPPPSGGEFGSYLFTQGIGTESGGALYLMPASAPLGTGATGNPVLTARATLDTNVDPANTVLGLKSSTITFSVTAVFNYVAPAENESYAVRLADRNDAGHFGTPSTFGDDVVDLQVFHTGSGNTGIRLREQDFINHTTTTLQTFSFNPSALVGVDQLGLTLARANPNTPTISASFLLLAAGQVTGTFSFTATSAIFSDENWTRAEFLASQAPVPEPQVYAMMLVGVGLVGLRIARSARRSRTLRIAGPDPLS